MLRTSLRATKVLAGRPVAAAAGRQWQVAASRRAFVAGTRLFADDKKAATDPSLPPVLPPDQTTTAPSTPPPSKSTIKARTVPPADVPLTPPTPPTQGTKSAVPSAASPSKAAPPPPLPTAKPRKGFFRRLRNYVLTLVLLGAIGFGGGVWYSRINDNFHDFFTEYIPFGEHAVLYFEEMDYRKRFPNSATRVLNKSRDTGSQVKIPAQSGASWRVADSGDTSGRQSSAVRKASEAKEAAAGKSPKRSKAAESAKKAEEPKPAPKSSAEKAAAPPEKTVPAVAVAKAESPVTSADVAFKPPEVNEPSRWPPASPINPLAVNDANEPVVQELVRMLNDIITVVNADKASEKYGATIGKAKNHLNKVGQQIKDMKAAVEDEAAGKLRTKVDDFDKAANELIERIQSAMTSQEKQWREEFEGEMLKIKESYDERLKTMTDREKQINEEKVNNRLLEQAVELKRQFAGEIRSHVEQERNGRLGKLNDLSSAVSDLERLTVGWNDVVDTNLRTQQLHVAVEAVRASLEDSTHPRPFTRELVALKEIASNDEVVNAAIASINPAAYQRGIPNSSSLIDRFRRVASEVRKASLLPDDAGVASHASSWALSKVMFKKQGLAAGDDVESILTRTQTHLEEGDLDAAAREMNGLHGWAKTLSKDWLSEVRKVLEVQQALEVIQTEARLQSLKLE